MLMRHLMIAGLALTAFAPAQGSILTSSVLKFNGSMVVSSMAVTFACNLPGDSTCAVNPPPNTGDFAVGGSTGSFAMYNGTFGLIKNLTNAAQPLNTLFSLPNAITFLNNLATFEATFMPLGSNALSSTCAGLMHCTPQFGSLVTPANPQGSSAFNLDQNMTGTVATLLLQGTLHDSTGPDQFFTGTFTASLAGLNPQQALAFLLSGQAVDYQAQVTLTAATPEPGTITLLGLGVLGLLYRRLRE